MPLPRFTIKISGNPGAQGASATACDLQTKHGENGRRCGRKGCPSCEAADLIALLKRHGITGIEASITHAEGHNCEYTDDLSSPGGLRRGYPE